jgi:hypothetical protein
MDTIRVWPVKPGQVYRPVFDAEEQLLQSIKKRKKNLEDKLISSPSASGDFSTDSLECENYGVKKERANFKIFKMSLIFALNSYAKIK